MAYFVKIRRITNNSDDKWALQTEGLSFKRLVLFQRLGERLQSVLQSSLLRWTLVETSRDHMSRLVHSGEAGILVCLTFNCHWTFSSISPRRIPKFKILVIKVFFFFSSQYPELLVASYNNNEDAPHEPDGVALVWNIKFKKATPEYVFHCQVLQPLP